MNTKVLHTLEYDKIIQLLIDKATSAPGRELCRRLIPSTDLSAIEEDVYKRQEIHSACCRMHTARLPA